jgi:xanthine dehydrogenase accessory factor
MKLRDLFGALLNKTEAGEDTVLVTIVAEAGSGPRSAGAHLLAGREGRITGTIGGGALEYAALGLAGELLARRQSGRKTYRLYPNDGEDLGMLCGGDVEVYFRFIPGGDPGIIGLAGELLRRLERDEDAWLFADLGGPGDDGAAAGAIALYSPGEPLRGLELGEGELGALARNRAVLLESGGRRLYGEPVNFAGKALIFGGGHVAQALAPLLDSVGFRCVIFDNREEFVRAELFPTAYGLIAGDYGDLFRFTGVGPRDYLIIATHGFDIPVLRQLIRRDWAYLGLIGSKRKIAAVKERLVAEGVEGEKLMRINAPIGLPIHSETPEEIAVSIAGELIRRRAELRDAEFRPPDFKPAGPGS